MLYICKDCPGHPDFLSQYNKENHRGQCHANITRCKDATGNPHELHRQPTGLFYCPTCGIGCDVANTIRPHVSKCREPKGSGEGRNVERMGGFAHPSDIRISKVTGTKNSSASPSPGPSPSSNANASSSRPAKATAPRSSLALSFATEDDSDDDEEEERTRKEKGRAEKDKDRLEVEKKREKAREESRKKERDREQERERERKASRPKPVEQPSGPRLPSLPSFKKKPAELSSNAGRTVPAGGSTSNGGSGTTFARAPNANEPHHPHSSFASGSNSSYPLPPPPFQPKPSSNLLPGFPNPPRPSAPLPNRISRLPSVDPLDSFNDHPPVAAAPQAPLSVIARPVNVDNPPSTSHSTYPSGLPLSNPNRRLPPPAKSSLKRPPPPPPPVVEPSIPRPSPAVVPSHLQAQPRPPLIANGASSSVQVQPKKGKGKAAAAAGPVDPPIHNAFEAAERMFHMNSGLKSQVGNFTLGKTPEEGKKLRKAVQKLLRALKPKKIKEPILKPLSSVGVPLKSFAPPPPNSIPPSLLSKPGAPLPASTSNASPLPLPLPVALTSTSAIVPPAPLPAVVPSAPAQLPPPFVVAPAVDKAPLIPAVVAPAPISTVDLASSSSAKRPREGGAEEDAPLAKKPMMMMKTGVEVDW